MYIYIFIYIYTCVYIYILCVNIYMYMYILWTVGMNLTMTQIYTITPSIYMCIYCEEWACVWWWPRSHHAFLHILIHTWIPICLTHTHTPHPSCVHVRAVGMGLTMVLIWKITPSSNSEYAKNSKFQKVNIYTCVCLCVWVCVCVCV